MSLKKWGGDYAKRIEKEITYLQSRINGLRVRKRKNRIDRLRDDANNWVERSHLLDLAKKYFTDILTSKNAYVDNSLDDYIPKLNDVDNH
nr:uncharacterized protein LOC109166477 [Ipomoea trifida]